MSLASTVAAGVALAKKLTASFQGDVDHYAWVGQDGEGADQFAMPVPRPALVDHKPVIVNGFDGKAVTARSYLAFLEPIPPTAPIAGQERQQPIDPRDVLVLPDGTTGPIVAVNGFVNGETSEPFMSECYLGGGGQP